MAVFLYISSSKNQKKKGHRYEKKEDRKLYQYTLLQIDPSSDAAKEVIYRSKASLDYSGLKIEPAHYKQVCQGHASGEISYLLESLFTRFNLTLPYDYQGRKLSVSDVILLRRHKREVAYFCDDFGFKKLPDFNVEEVIR